MLRLSASQPLRASVSIRRRLLLGLAPPQQRHTHTLPQHMNPFGTCTVRPVAVTYKGQSPFRGPQLSSELGTSRVP